MGNSSSSLGGGGSWSTIDQVHNPKFDIKSGDLIEIYRTLFDKHWVMCAKVEKMVDPYSNIEKGREIFCYHVTCPSNRNKSDNFEGSSFRLRYHTLREILEDSPYSSPSRRKNNQEIIAQEHILKQDDNYKEPNLDEVFVELEGKKDDSFDYNLVTRNCEHYCTQWKYGIPWSSQSRYTGWALSKAVFYTSLN